MTWISDENGNRASVERWGSEEKARASLATLKGCSRCSDCSGCSGCSGCSDCSDCSRCSDCSGCSGCSRCSRCSDCSRCSRCSRCSDCSRCSRCSRCSDCSGCSRCSDCSDCSDCSRCSRCSRCSGCSGCSDCSDCSRCSGLQRAAPVESSVTRTAAEIPIIEDLHAKIYAAASKPEALEMDSWHTCANTHCRAGWVIALAGQAGKELEKFHDTALAAMLIYDASCPGYKISPARFFDSNEDALEDMRKQAETAVSK